MDIVAVVNAMDMVVAVVREVEAVDLRAQRWWKLRSYIVVV